LKRFYCYFTNAKQRVVWDGQVSDIVDVEYNIRQGSLLGPVLYLLHLFDLPLTLQIRESDGNSAYAMTRRFGSMRRTSRRHRESYSD
jgi:hypothetical protein